jgi:hypothetical protein
MQRFGSSSEDMRDMNHDDTFLGRVKLLVVMLKTFLGDYPLGGYRQKAILKNAEAVHIVCKDWNRYIIQIRSTAEGKEGLAFDHILHQRISLLATMAKSFVQGNPMGYHRKRVMRANMEYVCDALRFNPQAEDIKLLKVA